MSESFIESKCLDLAKKSGYQIRKMMFIADTGCPDRLFFKPGHFFWVEFKKDKTGVLSKKQIYQIKLMSEAGMEVYVFESIEQFKGILK